MPKGLHVGWSGREYDAETGFSFHRARYYSPDLRRWTQEDPIGYAGGGNLYAYVGGAVMEARDPSGLMEDVSGRGLGFAEAERPWNGEDPFRSGLDDLHLPGGGSSVTIELVAVLANGDKVSCSEVPAQCAAFLGQGKDPLLSNPALLREIQSYAAAAGYDMTYRVEAGGWCSATSCTVHYGSARTVDIGKQPANAILGWHSHPNAGRFPADGDVKGCHGQYAGCAYGAVPSDWDRRRAGNQRYSVPMYVISQNEVWRYRVQFVSSGPQIPNGCQLIGPAPNCR